MRCGPVDPAPRALRIPLKNTALADSVPKRVPSALSYNGYGRLLCFVISGFLIATHTLARRGTLANIDVRAFHAHRAACRDCSPCSAPCIWPAS